MEPYFDLTQSLKFGSLDLGSDLLLRQSQLPSQLRPLPGGEVPLPDEISLQSRDLLGGEAGSGLLPITELTWLLFLAEAENVNNHMRGWRSALSLRSQQQRM